jgi:beta-glucosidase
MHWCLIDNFEWAQGFKIKFGLCGVGRATFKRTQKPSAAIYGAIARRNAVCTASGRRPPAGAGQLWRMT